MVAQDNGMAKLGDILYTGTPESAEFGEVETGNLTQGDVKSFMQRHRKHSPPSRDRERRADRLRKEPTRHLFHLLEATDGMDYSSLTTAS